MKTLLRTSAAMTVLAALGAGGSPAVAQTATTQAAPSGNNAIADIVVTATRREEALNKIPVAVQALSGYSLTKLNVVNFEKLIAAN